MQITESIHGLKIPFKISAAKEIERFVYIYFIYGHEIIQIDSGVCSSYSKIIDYLEEMNRNISELKVIVQTHSHPDHIGGSPAIIKASGCEVAAHVNAVPWIENVDLQAKERPSPYFYDLVDGSFKVDLKLNDGDVLNLENGNSLKTIYTPGHSFDSICLWFEKERALFSGDTIPIRSDYPIYEDVYQTIRSINKLKQIRDIRFLLSAWDDPKHDNDVYEVMEDSLKHIQSIHSVVRNKSLCSTKIDSRRLCNVILEELNYPITPNSIRSIESHLKIKEVKDLLKNFR